jgi:hypothetical protein
MAGRANGWIMGDREGWASHHLEMFGPDRDGIPFSACLIVAATTTY